MTVLARTASEKLQLFEQRSVLLRHLAVEVLAEAASRSLKGNAMPLSIDLAMMPARAMFVAATKPSWCSSSVFPAPSWESSSHPSASWSARSIEGIDGVLRR
jgi:hypothetical protein